jgi:hypothetical protein
LIQEELLQGAERLFLEDSRIDVEGAILSENGKTFGLIAQWSLLTFHEAWSFSALKTRLV